MNSLVSFDNLKLLVKDLDAVSAMILAYYKDEYTIEIKDDETPVTCADIKSDAMIRDILAKYTPTVPVISEEVTIPDYSIRKEFDYFWLVDPLDGTKEFINKTDEFAINIALIYKAKPVIGIIVTPVQKETYFATSNTNVEVYSRGEFYQLKKENNDSFIAMVSRSHKDDEAKDLLCELEQKHSITFESKVLGSSHKQIAILKNIADIYVKLSSGPKEWDFAAGQLLIEQSGGSIIDIKTNQPPLYNKEDFSMSGFIMKSEHFISRV